MPKPTPHISPIELLEVLEAFNSSTDKTRHSRGGAINAAEIYPRCLDEFTTRSTLLSERIEALTALVSGHHIDPWISPSEKVFCGPLFAMVLEVAAIAPLHRQQISPRFDPQEFVGMLIAFDYSASRIC